MRLPDIASSLIGRESITEEEDPGAVRGDSFFQDVKEIDEMIEDGPSTDDGEDLFGDVENVVEDDELDELRNNVGDLANVKSRIDDLENDVKNISSTIGSVENENEAIKNSIEEIEDNIRKLLEIYEMVTQGANPFVSDDTLASGEAELFDQPHSTEDGEFNRRESPGTDTDTDRLLEEITKREEATSDSGFLDGSPVDGLPDDGGLMDSDDTSINSDDSTNDVTTFDDLKSEYRLDEDNVGESTKGTDEGVEGERGKKGYEGTAPGKATDEGQRSSGKSESVAPENRQDEAVGFSIKEGDRDDKPYLVCLPAGYGAEILVTDWLRYLIKHSNPSEALRAIRYYETIGWIGEEAGRSLESYITGLASDDVSTASDGATQLSIEHHTTSLHYIGRLGEKDVNIHRLEWKQHSTSRTQVEDRGDHGIQR